MTDELLTETDPEDTPLDERALEEPAPEGTADDAAAGG